VAVVGQALRPRSSTGCIGPSKSKQMPSRLARGVPAQVLRVAQDDDDGAIEVDEDQVMRPPAPRAVRAVVGVLTALLSD